MLIWCMVRSVLADDMVAVSSQNSSLTHFHPTEHSVDGKPKNICMNYSILLICYALLNLYIQNYFLHCQVLEKTEVDCQHQDYSLQQNFPRLHQMSWRCSPSTSNSVHGRSEEEIWETRISSSWCWWWNWSNIKDAGLHLYPRSPLYTLYTLTVHLRRKTSEVNNLLNPNQNYQV